MRKSITIIKCNMTGAGEGASASAVPGTTIRNYYLLNLFHFKFNSFVFIADAANNNW